MASKDLSSVSIQELRSEIARRERHLASLHRTRDRLTSQIQELEQEILQEGGALGALVGGKRPRNRSNLADALVDLLGGQTLSVTEAAEQVQAAGYRTISPNFRTIVNQTLLKEPRIRRVGRGRYTARANSKGAKGPSKGRR